MTTNRDDTAAPMTHVENQPLSVELVWYELTPDNYPVAETVVVSYFDDGVGEWVLAVKDAPIETFPWTHFLRPGRPDDTPSPAPPASAVVSDEVFDRAYHEASRAFWEQKREGGPMSATKHCIREAVRVALATALQTAEAERDKLAKALEDAIHDLDNFAAFDYPVMQRHIARHREALAASRARRAQEGNGE